jgi:hypothetical protein
MSNYLLNKAINDIENDNDISWIDFINIRDYNYIEDCMDPPLWRKLKRRLDMTLIGPYEYSLIHDEEYKNLHNSVVEGIKKTEEQMKIYERYYDELDRLNIGEKDYNETTIILNNY